ncbi:hypothetical protein ACFFGH_31915 [Lysobacter korlensis]|uniref:Uncharacterized protein n=1 Tax=Lysobacter korlensis TaxID=553636 RepID=A0ABV6RZQ6_9GAMM
MLASAVRITSVGAAAAALILLITGCSPQAPSAEPSAPPTTAVAEPTPEPTTTPTPAGPTAPPPIPFEIACDTLVSPETIYAFNPNFALLPEPVVEPGSLAERVQTEQGTICSWQHLSSGEILTVAAAELPAETLVLVQNDAFEASNMVPTYGGDEGYFTVRAGTGEAQTFSGSHWVVSTSPTYLEPGDAADILAAAIAAVG